MQAGRLRTTNILINLLRRSTKGVVIVPKIRCPFLFVRAMVVSLVMALATCGTSPACPRPLVRTAPAARAEACAVCTAGQPPVADASNNPVGGHPVRYLNGDVRMVTDDMGGGASPAGLWGHTRSYSSQNSDGSGYNYSNGSRWFVKQWPQVTLDPKQANVGGVFSSFSAAV